MRAPHRQSHVDALVPTLPDHVSTRVDAVVVAAGRLAGTVGEHAQLAARLGAHLLVMCSPGGLSPSAVAALGQSGRAPAPQAVFVPAGFAHPVLHFATSDRPESGVDRLGVLSVKRNLALLIGRMVGWRRLLFLDDDITGVRARDVQEAAHGLSSRLDAVGLVVDDWPDHSVVCHANRLSGGAQETFVSGSALVVDPQRPPGFFPQLYNEDWLFLYPALQQRRVARIGRARQRWYDPFVPGRAAVEEFGEVVAEGLLEALHSGTTAPPPHTAAFWTGFLEDRRLFIERTRGQVVRTDEPWRDAALRSLDEAEEHRRRITAATCVAFHRDWRSDLIAWRARLDALPHVPDIGAAIERLGLGSTVPDLVP